MSLSEITIEKILEQIGSKGCVFTRQILTKLNQNQVPAELHGLSSVEQNKVKEALAEIMSVYDRCDV